MFTTKIHVMSLACAAFLLAPLSENASAAFSKTYPIVADATVGAVWSPKKKAEDAAIDKARELAKDQYYLYLANLVTAGYRFSDGSYVIATRGGRSDRDLALVFAEHYANSKGKTLDSGSPFQWYFSSVWRLSETHITGHWPNKRYWNVSVLCCVRMGIRFG